MKIARIAFVSSLALVFLVLAAATSARAECAMGTDGLEKCYPEFDVPATSAPDHESTDRADIRLTPDRSEILRVSKDVGSVVIGSPQTLSVFVDTPQSLVLVPKAPGATYFTVLDKTGNVIMERHVLVAAPKRGYVRVRTTCMGKDADACTPARMYYCPSGAMCHDVPLAASSGSAKDKTATELGKLMMKSIDPQDDQASETADPAATDVSE